MIRIAARGVEKRYGVVRALKSVDFDVHAGAVNVLIGENGAGKSTLMRIIAGVETLDGGDLVIEGKPAVIRSVQDAAAYGIGIVHQELSLCPNLSVTQNIFLERVLARGVAIDHRRERARAVELLARLGAAINPDTLVGALRVGEQQIVEIARALSRDVSVLILDEPTSALSAAETERLFQVVDELRGAGVAIIYISHRLEEIVRIGDHVTVLRDGERVAYAERGEFSVEWIVHHMLGGATTAPRRTACTPGSEMLVVTDLEVPRANGNLAVADASFSVRCGEITALYGLLGAGRSELFEAICGALPARGSIRVDGVELTGKSLRARLRHGVQFVAEDRKTEGLFANFSVARNMSVSVLDRLRRMGFLSAEHESGAVRPMMGRMGVKAASPDIAIGALSGGNQQKVLIGRALLPGPRLVLLDEPGRGVDIGARAEIFEVMRELAAEGIAVLFSTSDLVEAIAAADRVLVMAGGRITDDMPAAQASEDRLVRAANATAPIPSVTEAA
ncbi:sugar ABC transporter ATP-binding protein [Sphingomonas sanxanigenens]|uniref:ABC transporter domain-containing protein n=1 Tax=Sphingomonas sanxanigenens DSM 19645 = NX02 TaxID=1123269 RepID=W0ACS9_9SPHN|nr:sugar ABC transporter ATP-binding protein [Sphingomonas sanxanigenens]AHE55704.1 hypothetical protein NX02_20235 [Sphingomonas sanxanigenens DSM 19645 = NX02]